MQTKKFLISDMHIGTTMWQSAMLRAAGIPTAVHSLSSHSHYINEPELIRAPFLDEINSNTDAEIASSIVKTSALDGITHALCSFPPSRIFQLMRLPESIRMTVNIGHRIHIHVPGDQLLQVNDAFVRMATNPRFSLAAMSAYDEHYLRYYTGIPEIRALPVTCAHIPEVLRAREYRPTNRVVLVGPSHNLDRLIHFRNLEEINRESKIFAATRGLEPYTFAFIKQIYPNNNNIFKLLSEHPAVLMVPYSAFSISMVELYQLNIPFFVPDDDSLVNAMNDVRLAPIYQNEENVMQLDNAIGLKSWHGEYPYSPNDPTPAAQRWWMKYMYFNQVRHCVRFKSPEQFFERLYLSDLSNISSQMKQENDKIYKDQLLNWCHWLNTF